MWPETDGTATTALLTLGRVDGALTCCLPTALHIFLGRWLRHTLMSALQQEGHEFTEERFSAWFAGLTGLSDAPHRNAAPPWALCQAVLLELRHSPWPLLATAAARLSSMFLAPRDLESDGALERSLAVLGDAHHLIDCLRCDRSSLPRALEDLCHAISTSTRFAPSERTVATLPLNGRNLQVERVGTPSPRWAVELLYGRVLVSLGILRSPLPCVGLIRLDALTGEPGEAYLARLEGLHVLATNMQSRLDDAIGLAKQVIAPFSGLRSSSRAPDLFALLAGFGPLRSSQLEAALGCTRLGVRTMIHTLEGLELVGRRTVAGCVLYSLNMHAAAQPHAPLAEHFSTAALNEYEASLADLDRLLGSGADSD